MRDFFLVVNCLIILVIVSMGGCKATPKKSKLENMYGNKFVGVNAELPYLSSNVKTIGMIKSASPSYFREYGAVKYEDVWNASMIVMTQKSAIIRASKEDGVIVALPYALYIEQGDSIIIYPYFDTDVYQLAEDPEKSIIEIDAKGIDFYLTLLMDEITTCLQLERKIGEEGQWTYLLN